MARPRLLLSCRDPGAAGHMAVLAPRLGQRFDVTLLAQPPANRLLTASGIEHHAFIPQGEGARLLDAARARLDAIRPQAILTGVSGPGVGLDEALLAVGRNRVACLTLQDWWADLNMGMKAPPDVLLVRDQLAARLTIERFPHLNLCWHAVGLPKYAVLDGVDVVGLRRRARADLGLAEKRPVVGFFGQPLLDDDGYRQTLVALGRGAGKRPFTLILRPHPKEDAQASARLIAPDGIDDGADPWPLLAACDLVTSGFSTSIQDAVALWARAREPMGAALYILPPALGRTYRRLSGLSGLFLAEAGIVGLCGDLDELPAMIGAGLEPAARAAALASAHGYPALAPGAADRVLEVLTRYADSCPPSRAPLSD